jgi:hypothetical protein
MPLDASLLDQAKTAEARVIDAEHAAEVARADFHRAVRRLQLAGASLREIADALGLSHQRIHQIVASAGGSRRWRSHRPAAEHLQSCTFCGRDQKHVKTLIGGPGGYICDRCVARADTVLAAGKTAVEPGGALWPVRAEARAERCSFCGKRRYQVPGMAAAERARICDECLRLCHEIRDDRLT